MNKTILIDATGLHELITAGECLVFDCRFNLIDARDVATGMIAAMKKGRPGVRYLLGGQNYRLADWLKVLGKEVGRPVPRFTVPYSLALTVALPSISCRTWSRTGWSPSTCEPISTIA